MTVKANDRDANSVITYELVSSSGDGRDIFYLLPSTGEIRTMKSLKNVTQTTYFVS